MNPEQFLARIAKQPPAPAYLFLGQESYGRRLCKQALLERVLQSVSLEDGLTNVDLDETTLTEVIDDARSLSLFSHARVIWVSSAELALPRRITAAASEEDGDATAGSGTVLSTYLASPTPETVIVFEASRFDFSGDDKPKLDRVQKFYAGVPATVEFRHYTPETSRFLAQELAQKNGLKLAGAELTALLDAVAGDAGRLASEIEKLALFLNGGQASGDRRVTLADLRSLVPNAAQTTIFELVNALGRRDRGAALRSLDILVREGEYLPLALTFLSTQFRLALAAKENNLRSAQQAQAFFGKIGVRIWRERSEQVLSTAGAFSRQQLDKAVALIYETDKKFRDGYRNDRLVMETLVFGLT